MFMEDKYRKYLFEHIHNVKKAYDWIKENLPEYAICEVNAYLHDNSKFTDEEFDAYANYFYGDKTAETIDNFDYAWNHHQKVNPHHWQYWVLINDEDGTKCLDMPLEYIVEMICDWWSFSWKVNNIYEMFNWYEKNKNNIMLSDKTRTTVEDIFEKIKDKFMENEVTVDG